MVNNLLNLASHFHRVTVGFRLGPSRCHGFFKLHRNKGGIRCNWLRCSGLPA